MKSHPDEYSLDCNHVDHFLLFDVLHILSQSTSMKISRIHLETEILPTACHEG